MIRRCGDALRLSGCFVLLDIKRPQRAPDSLVRLGLAVTAPFGVTIDLAERRPWQAMQECFGNLSFDDLYFGFSYVAQSRKPYPPEEPTLVV